MPTLVKRPNSPFWFACFSVTNPDGTVRRLKKSTKRTKKAEAISEAIKLEEAERRESTATTEQAQRAFEILKQAAKTAARGELSEARGREMLASLVEVSTGTPMRSFTVRTWAAEWLAMKKATTKAATRKRYTTHINSFTAWLGDRADAKLEAVTKTDVREFRDAIRSGWNPEGDAPAGPDQPQAIRTAKTTNQYAADAASMFRTAVREGLLLASPAAALERLPEIDSTEREVFTVEEISQIVRAAKKPEWMKGILREDPDDAAARCADWQGLILLGYYSGARLDDCAHLTWGVINKDRSAFTFMPSKTDRKRTRLEIPIHPRLATWLAERAGSISTGPTAPLFPTLATERPGGSQGLSAQFIAIMQTAGVDRRQVRKGIDGVQRAQYARSFHSLRHSLTSTLANLDVPEEIRRKIVGHESAGVHAGYTHTDRATLARAIEKVPSI